MVYIHNMGIYSGFCLLITSRFSHFGARNMKIALVVTRGHSWLLVVIIAEMNEKMLDCAHYFLILCNSLIFK